MPNLVFAFMQAHGGDERESILLAHSLRAFAGTLADAQIWVMVSRNLNRLSDETRRELEALSVQLIPFVLPDAAIEFPFAAKVFAAAAGEMRAQAEAGTLVWMDSDTVCVQEPAEFHLPAGVSLGYRPVMLKNISSLHAEPADRFWKLIYKGCDTPESRIFPMQTSVDGMLIRPQFNAGLLVVRPERGLLRAWREVFERLYLDPVWDEFYKRNILYHFFIHQAVLSATLLAQLEQKDMHCLSEKINYPIFLHPRIPVDRQPAVLNEVITFRYDAFKFFDDPKWKDILPVRQPLLDFLENH